MTEVGRGADRMINRISRSVRERGTKEIEYVYT
jgi:hypothetical protein